MRCFTCGGEMRVAQVAPDKTLPVGGYEHRTLECSQCGDTERRLMFAGDKPSSAADQPIATDTNVGPPSSEAPPARWAQAAERLRAHQAVLALEAAAQKASEASASEEHTRGQAFDRLWDNLGKSQPQTIVPKPVPPTRTQTETKAPAQWELALPKRPSMPKPAADVSARAAAVATSAARMAGQSARGTLNRALSLLRAATERRPKPQSSDEPRPERHDAILQIDTDALKVMPPKRPPLPR